jgi:hypothetical protein
MKSRLTHAPPTLPCRKLRPRDGERTEAIQSAANQRQAFPSGRFTAGAFAFVVAAYAIFFSEVLNFPKPPPKLVS